MRRTTVVLQVLDFVLSLLGTCVATAVAAHRNSGAMFKVMQRRCPYGGAVSHSEAAAGWTAVKEQRRTALP
jgi:hypothetical protein